MKSIKFIRLIVTLIIMHLNFYAHTQPNFSYHPEPEIEKICQILFTTLFKQSTYFENNKNYSSSSMNGKYEERSFRVFTDTVNNRNDTIWGLRDKEFVSVAQVIIKKVRKSFYNNCQEFQSMISTQNHISVIIRLSEKRDFIKNIFPPKLIDKRLCHERIYTKIHYINIQLNRNTKKVKVRRYFNQNIICNYEI